MSLIDWFAARRKDQFVGKVSQDTDEGDGLWVKCSECSQVAYRKDLISNFNVCSNCGLLWCPQLLQTLKFEIRSFL